MGWREKEQSVVSCWPGGARSRAVSPPCEGRPGCPQEEGRGRGRHHQRVRISTCETQRRPRPPSPRLRPTEREGVSAFEAGPSRSFCFTAIENHTVPSARRPWRERPVSLCWLRASRWLPRCLAASPLFLERTMALSAAPARRVASPCSLCPRCGHSRCFRGFGGFVGRSPGVWLPERLRSVPQIGIFHPCFLLN